MRQVPCGWWSECLVYQASPACQQRHQASGTTDKSKWHTGGLPRVPSGSRAWVLGDETRTAGDSADGRPPLSLSALIRASSSPIGTAAMEMGLWPSRGPFPLTPSSREAFPKHLQGLAAPLFRKPVLAAHRPQQLFSVYIMFQSTVALGSTVTETVAPSFPDMCSWVTWV